MTNWKTRWNPRAIGFTEKDDVKAKVIQTALEIATPQIFKFIEKEIIENLIDEIPDVWQLNQNEAWNEEVPLKLLKVKLRDKWL